MSDYKFQSGIHFSNVVVKIARDIGYDSNSFRRKLVLIFNNYDKKQEKLNDFTLAVKHTTTKKSHLSEMIDSILKGEEPKKNPRSKPGEATTDYVKLYYSDAQKEHFEHLWNKSGIYRLHDEFGNVKYIGKSVNLGSRLLSSLNEKELHRYSYVQIDNKADVNIYEMYYIAKYKPEFNKDGMVEDYPTFELKEHEFTDIKFINVTKQEVF